MQHGAIVALVLACAGAGLAGPLAAQTGGAAAPIQRIEEGRERWTVTTDARGAVLALGLDGRPAPLLQFICSRARPGLVSVIAPDLSRERAERRLRIDLRAGEVEASALAEGPQQLHPDRAPPVANLRTEEFTNLLRARANSLSWRFELFDGVSRPRMVALLPNPMNRQRADFMRHCA